MSSPTRTRTRTRTPSLLLTLFLCVTSFFLSTTITSVQALKFDLPASSSSSDAEPHCIWNFAKEHSLVIVTAIIQPAAYQRLDIEIRDGSGKGNVYLNKKNLNGETRLAVTTHETADVGVCLRNYLDANAPKGKHSRVIDLDIDVGAEAIDFNAIASQESFSVLETEVAKLESVVKDIVDELEYLQRREMRMRDTNESTNARVQNFGLLTIFVLIGLGIWQLLHLRSFFRRKYLID